jgi:hypothetical protein
MNKIAKRSVGRRKGKCGRKREGETLFPVDICLVAIRACFDIESRVRVIPRDFYRRSRFSFLLWDANSLIRLLFSNIPV